MHQAWEKAPKNWSIPVDEHGHHHPDLISDSPGLILAIIGVRNPSPLLTRGFHKEWSALHAVAMRERTLLIAIARCTNKGKARANNVALLAWNSMGKMVFKRGLTFKGAPVADAIEARLQPEVDKITIIPF